MGIKAVVAGATGLVGRCVTEEMLRRAEVEEVRILVRRDPGIRHSRLKIIEVDWDGLDGYRDVFNDVHDVYCCLGTTIKKAGSQQAFRKVDQWYVKETARLAQNQGAVQFLAVSSMGANPKSKAFYSRVKGEVEQELAGMAFRSLHLFRPSLLLGHREEHRTGEKCAAVLMKALDFAFKGPLAPYRAIPADKVARAMVNIALTNTPRQHVYANDVIHVLGT